MESSVESTLQSKAFAVLTANVSPNAGGNHESHAPGIGHGAGFHSALGYAAAEMHSKASGQCSDSAPCDAEARFIALQAIIGSCAR